MAPLQDVLYVLGVREQTGAKGTEPKRCDVAVAFERAHKTAERIRPELLRVPEQPTPRRTRWFTRSAQGLRSLGLLRRAEPQHGPSLASDQRPEMLGEREALALVGRADGGAVEAIGPAD
jgi:hypothetical protein